MRVLHVTDGYLPRVGGIELHVQDLVERQRSAGWDARVLTATAGVGGDPPWVGRVPGRSACAELVAQTPLVVHAHLSVASPFAVRLARESARRGIPLAITVHSMWTGWGPLPGLTVAAGGASRSRAAWSAVSGPAAAAVARALGGEIPVQVVGNAVDIERWRPATPFVAAPVRPVTVVSVMRLTRTKRTRALADVLVRARHRLPAGTDLRAVVIGDGPQAPVLRRRLTRAGADPWVHLAGRLDRDSVLAHLRAADIFLAPADREAFCIAALEARTAGLAVVAKAHSGVADFIDHGRNGLLATDDEGLADAVAALAGDPRVLTGIRAHNSQHPPLHGWAHLLAQVGELYATACERAATLPTRGRALPSRAVAA